MFGCWQFILQVKCHLRGKSHSYWQPLCVLTGLSSLAPSFCTWRTSPAVDAKADGLHRQPEGTGGGRDQNSGVPGAFCLSSQLWGDPQRLTALQGLQEELSFPRDRGHNPLSGHMGILAQARGLGKSCACMATSTYASWWIPDFSFLACLSPFPTYLFLSHEQTSLSLHWVPTCAVVREQQGLLAAVREWAPPSWWYLVQIK